MAIVVFGNAPGQAKRAEEEAKRAEAAARRAELKRQEEEEREEMAKSTKAKAAPAGLQKVRGLADSECQRGTRRTRMRWAYLPATLGWPSAQKGGQG